MSDYRELREKRVKESYQRLRTEHRNLLDQCVAIATMVDHELKQSPERVDRLPARIEEELVSLVCRALDAAGRGA